jgi:hypothetical protein
LQYEGKVEAVAVASGECLVFNRDKTQLKKFAPPTPRSLTPNPKMMEAARRQQQVRLWFRLQLRLYLQLQLNRPFRFK